MADEIDIPINSDDAVKAVNALTAALKKFGSEGDKSIDEFATKQKSAFSQITSSFTALGTAAVAGVAVAALAIKELVGFLGDSVDSAAKEEQALNRLKTALDLTGEGGQVATQEMSDFADQLEKTTKFSNEQALSSLALAKSFGLTNQQAKELTKAAADLSAATGQDLETSTRQLGNTYSGVTGKLDELVPALKNLTKEELAAGAATKIIADRFGGSAAREIDTFSGAITQAGNAFEDFQKSFGRIIIQNPAVIAGIKEISAIFQALGQAVDDNKDGINGFITEFLSGILNIFPDIIRGVGAIAQSFLILTENNPFSEIQDSANKTADGINDAASAATKFSFIILRLEEDFVALKKLIAELHLATSFDIILPGARNAREDTQEIIKGYQDQINKLEELQQKLADSSTKNAIAIGYNAAKESLDDTSKSINVTKTAAEKLADEIEKLSEGIKKSGKDSEIAGKKMSGALRTPKEDVSKLLEELKKLEDTLSKSIGNASDQARSELQSNIDLINEAEQKGLRNFRQAEEDRVNAFKVANDKILKADQDTQKELTDQAAKAAAERKSRVESIASNPGSLINASIVDGDSITAAIVGAIAAGAQGAAGAKKLVGGVVGAIADAYIPGIGGVVSQIVELVAGDPKVTAATFKGFAEALPEIVDNLARALPDIIAALLDSLVNKGLFLKLMFAYFEAIGAFVEEIAKNIGKAIGVETGDAFKGPQFRKSVTELYEHAGEVFLDTINKGISKFQTGIFDASKQFHIEIGNAGQAIKDGILSIGPAIQDVMDEAGRSLGLTAISTLDDNFLSFFNKGGAIADGLFSKMNEGLQEFIDKGRSISDGLFEGINEAIDFFKNLGGQIAEGIKDNFSIDSITGGGGDGGGGGIFKKLPKFALGGEVGPGYAGDGLVARLSSGENVIDGSTNQKLRSFLDGGGSGGLSAVLLAKIADLLSQPLTTSSTVKVNDKAFADIILSLNRRNARTVA